MRCETFSLSSNFTNLSVRVLMIVSTCLTFQSVHAQSYDDVGSRLANIEKRLNALGGGAGAARGDIELRMQDLETENSQVNGNFERLSNSVQQLSKKIDAIVKDMDMRLQDLENKQANAGAPRVAADASAGAEETGDVSDVTVQTEKKTVSVKVPDNLTATEHYNKAYGFLTAADYPNAQKWLESFIQKFPKDKLGDNAYYWLGEVYLVENKPTEAVKAFKGGLTAFPQGAKAPANYLKMGVALQQLKKPEMAKVVWEKLVKDHPRTAEANKAKDYLLELKNGGKASK